MSNSNRRRKRDCQVLNRKELYEKYIPHISRDFAKIVEKSKNNKFKQRCQQFLKVDDRSKIEEAIATQLFKLTLGSQDNGNMSRNTQENRGQNIDDEQIQSCFGDLARHIDDDQWPIFNEHSSLPAESVPGVNMVPSLCAGKGIATSVSCDDDNFNSLELHAMFEDTSWPDNTAGYLGGQRVQYGNILNTIKIPQNYQPKQSDTSALSDRDEVANGNINSAMQALPQNYQPALHHVDTSRMRSALPDSDKVASGSISSTMLTLPQNYQSALHHVDTSRMRGTLPDSGQVASGNVKSTIQALSQSYQPALHHVDTRRMRGTDSGQVASGNISSTIQALPQNYQPASHYVDTSRTRSALSHSDGVPCCVKSTSIAVPQYYQPVLGTSTAESALMESDDSHFETLANMF